MGLWYKMAGIRKHISGHHPVIADNNSTNQSERTLEQDKIHRRLLCASMIYMIASLSPGVEAFAASSVSLPCSQSFPYQRSMPTLFTASTPDEFGASRLPQESSQGGTKLHQLSPFESWCMERMTYYYAKSETVKCPFFRRRCSDLLDHLEWFLRRFLFHPDRSHLLGPPLSCLHVGCAKTTNLSKAMLVELIRRDWNRRKGYYVNGQLTTSIYRNDCLFESPDPDLPIKGLRKYLGVAAKLFDRKSSHSELVSLQYVSDDTILANWTMEITLKVPWRPRIPKFSGTTIYYLDDEHLICCHSETWELPVLSAFLAMFGWHVTQTTNTHKNV